MKLYRITCLTPTLAGDGQKLAPIDYMVWRDQVNVLDQNRIFRLLARGPRLDSYLTQIGRAEKLDFATWGGFAQNFAGRRISFEDSSLMAVWERTRGEHLFIPTFAATGNGIFLPGTAIKGALRTSILVDRAQEGQWHEAAQRLTGENAPRHPGEALEASVLGNSHLSRFRPISVSDSRPAPQSSTKVYLVRVASLVERGGKTELGWKASPRGTVDQRRLDDSTPYFVEMATPGTAFEGQWRDLFQFQKPEMLRALRWKEPLTSSRVLESANRAAAQILTAQKAYAEKAGLARVAATVGQLQNRLKELETSGTSCLMALGWGTGLLGKTGFTDGRVQFVRDALRQAHAFETELRTSLPLPKTRRVVFLKGLPSSLPGWVQLDLFA
jgi:CRISPR-associated protein Csm5